MKVRTDFLDFPTAWKIQKETKLKHDPKCSSVPGWHPMSGSHFLCDCGAMVDEWKRLVVEQKKENE